jgi:hypothetical protein
MSPDNVINRVRDFPLLRQYALDKIMKVVGDSRLEWTTSRHENYPTTDREVCDFREIDLMLFPYRQHVILPVLCRMFRVLQDELILRDEFLVKYDASEQSSLEEHRDGSLFSYVIQLNDPSEFKGGGTRFLGLGKTVRPCAGSCVTFCGKQLHAGLPVTAGKRYILTGFVDWRPPLSKWPQFTSLGADIRVANDFVQPYCATNVIKLMRRHSRVGNDLARHMLRDSSSVFEGWQPHFSTSHGESWSRFLEMCNDKRVIDFAFGTVQACN